MNKNFNIDPENILKDIVEKLRILKISNFKYESFVKYLNVDKKCFSLIVSAYKLFKKMLGVKMLQQFLET